MAFYKEEQLRDLGLKNLGNDVLISTKASIYGAEHIEIGDHTRIDDFCVLSASGKGLVIGSHVHIAVFCSLIGAETMVLGDYCGLSARVCIYSSSDDYSGAAMTNPTIPERFRQVDSRPVTLGRHVIVGAGTVVLPGVEMGLGSAAGALSLVSRSVDPFTIVSGVPARRVKARMRTLLDLERQYQQEVDRQP